MLPLVARRAWPWVTPVTGGPYIDIGRTLPPSGRSYNRESLMRRFTPIGGGDGATASPVAARSSRFVPDDCD